MSIVCLCSEPFAFIDSADSMSRVTHGILVSIFKVQWEMDLLFQNLLIFSFCLARIFCKCSFCFRFGMITWRRLLRRRNRMSRSDSAASKSGSPEFFFSNVHIASDTLVIPPLETFQWSNKSCLWFLFSDRKQFSRKRMRRFFCLKRNKFALSISAHTRGGS